MRPGSVNGKLGDRKQLHNIAHYFRLSKMFDKMELCYSLTSRNFHDGENMLELTDQAVEFLENMLVQMGGGQKVRLSLVET